MGRFTLGKDEGVVHWDLASGIGSACLAVLEARLPYSSYRCVEISEISRGVFRANIPGIEKRYADAPKDLQLFDVMQPQNLFTFYPVDAGQAEAAAAGTAAQPDHHLLGPMHPFVEGRQR